MKKLISLTLALMIAVLALLPAMAEETRTIRTGVLSMLNQTEAEMVNYYVGRAIIGRQLYKEGLQTNVLYQIWEEGQDGEGVNLPNLNAEIVYYDTLDAMLMALNAGNIDAMEIYETTAQYLVHSDPRLVQFVTLSDPLDENIFARVVRGGLLSNDFAFMFMEKNAALRDEFDAALASFTEEEMEKLVQEHITAAINGDEISPIQMPVIEGAETIKVAVTGSLPPMDYVAADGTPAGFNTALLAEISQRMGKNIELVVVDSVGRAAALASGTVDAVFWTRTSGESNTSAILNEEEHAKLRETVKQDMSEEEFETFEKVEALIDFADYDRLDMPEGVIITEPYFSDVIVPVATQVRLDKAAARANQCAHILNKPLSRSGQARLVQDTAKAGNHAMMNKIEEAIVYATVMHQGKVRKLGGTPYILHPLEVAQILSTMTNDQDVITAGILHDIVEDTDGTLQEIEKHFGERVAFLVSSESENDYPGESKDATWQRRKEESLKVLKNTDNQGVRMLWLADKLANIRSLAGNYSERGDKLWESFHQRDPEMHRWYYTTIAEQLELSLNKTGAFKELIKHINFIWPGTFDSEKARYKKYKEVSIDGCRLIGRGAKGDVYRYDDELVIKVYNQNNTYHDVEREIALSRKAFILGIPTAISFGIVSVKATSHGGLSVLPEAKLPTAQIEDLRRGTVERYGAMYELVESETISRHIARDSGQVNTYAKMMAELARTIHAVTVSEADGFPFATERLTPYIEGGIGRVDEALAERCMTLVNGISTSQTLLHGDFHTGNVFLQKGESLLIDMDRLSTGHPIAEISDLYYFYVVLGEDDPAVVADFMGFPYETAKEFFRSFLTHYLETEDENRLREVTEKASLLAWSRMIHQIYKKRSLSDEDRKRIDRYARRIAGLVERLETLTF